MRGIQKSKEWKRNKIRESLLQHKNSMQVPTQTGPGVQRSKRPLVSLQHLLQMFYRNILEFRKKVELGNKSQFRNKIMS